jgi:hypothetical protein
MQNLPYTPLYFYTNIYHCFCRSNHQTSSGLRKILKWMHTEYPISEMYIAGYLGRPMTGRQSLEDVENVMWYKSHINEVLKGMNIFSIRLFRIISIPSKTFYFRLPNHVILIEC